MEHFTQLYGKEEENTEKNMHVATKSIQQIIDSVKIMGDWKGSIGINTDIKKKRQKRARELSRHQLNAQHSQIIDHNINLDKIEDIMYNKPEFMCFVDLKIIIYRVRQKDVIKQLETQKLKSK